MARTSFENRQPMNQRAHGLRRELSQAKVSTASIRQAKRLGHSVSTAGDQRETAMRDAPRKFRRIQGSSIQREFYDDRK